MDSDSNSDITAELGFMARNRVLVKKRPATTTMDYDSGSSQDSYLNRSISTDHDSDFKEFADNKKMTASNNTSVAESQASTSLMNRRVKRLLISSHSQEKHPLFRPSLQESSSGTAISLEQKPTSTSNMKQSVLSSLTMPLLQKAQPRVLISKLVLPPGYSPHQTFTVQQRSISDSTLRILVHSHGNDSSADIPQNGQIVTAIKPSKPSIAKKYRCLVTKCGELMDTKLDLQKHCHDTHKLPAFPCPYRECDGKLFIGLLTHLKRHEKLNLKCRFCNQAFDKKAAYLRHLYLTHAIQLGLYSNPSSTANSNDAITLQEKLKQFCFSSTKTILDKNYFLLNVEIRSQRTLFAFEKINISNLMHKPPYDRPRFIAPEPAFGFLQISEPMISDAGFSCGHLIPAANCKFSATAYESTFVISNIVAMVKQINEGVWQSIEAYLRKLANYCNALYVFTIPVYMETETTDSPETLVKVHIPESLIKLVYLEKEGEIMTHQAFIVDNKLSAATSKFMECAATIDDIKKLVKLDFLGAPATWDLNKGIESHPCTQKKCQDVFKSAEELVQHSQRHANEKVCKVCSNVFLSAALLEKHQSENHVLYKCSRCDFSHIRKEFMQVHEKTHTRELLFKCNVVKCKKAFHTSRSLRQHALTHTNVRNYKCSEPGCNMAYKYPMGLLRHKRVNHRRERLICRFCKQQFRFSDTLNKHIKRKHPEKYEEPVTRRWKTRKVNSGVHHVTLQHIADNRLFRTNCRKNPLADRPRKSRR